MVGIHDAALAVVSKLELLEPWPVLTHPGTDLLGVALCSVPISYFLAELPVEGADSAGNVLAELDRQKCKPHCLVAVAGFQVLGDAFEGMEVLPRRIRASPKPSHAESAELLLRVHELFNKARATFRFPKSGERIVTDEFVEASAEL